MPYSDQKEKLGREPVAILELEIDTCSLTYGSSPCTASGPAATKCFNCLSTCQDTANYTKTTKTFRFSSVRIDELQGDDDTPTFPTIMGISTAPTVLTPGKGFGIRSTCSIKLMDHTFNDVGYDKYLSGRTYVADEQGSFWSKFLAREQYYEGRKATVSTGYLNDDGTYDASNFIDRVYFIETISGPSNDGRVTIKTTDILKFADANKAQLPIQSQAETVNDMTSSATSFDITDPNDDIKDSYDAGQKYIRIEDETMLMTNITGSNPSYTVTVIRAAMPGVYNGNMVADEHSEESTVQQCYHFDTIAINDIVEYLLDDVAGIDPSFLDVAGWQTVIDFGLQSYLFSALITEPTGVSELISELTEHTILIWYDERAQLVKMDSLLNRRQDYGPFTDQDSIVADSVSVARNDKSRVSQVWFSYGHRNPVEPLDELKNFTTTKLSVNLELEGVDAYDESLVRRIWSRWVPRDSGSIASEIATRLLNYYKVTKKNVTITMDPKDDSAWTGSLINLSTRQIQDVYGANPTLNYRVLQVTEAFQVGDVRYKYVVESTDQDFQRIGLITPDLDPGDGVSAFPDYGSASTALKNQYAFICYDDRSDGNPGFPPDEAPYEIQ
jgi:hypothetical protein